MLRILQLHVITDLSKHGFKIGLIISRNCLWFCTCWHSCLPNCFQICLVLYLLAQLSLALWLHLIEFCVNARLSLVLYVLAQLSSKLVSYVLAQLSLALWFLMEFCINAGWARWWFTNDLVLCVAHLYLEVCQSAWKCVDASVLCFYVVELKVKGNV